MRTRTLRQTNSVWRTQERLNGTGNSGYNTRNSPPLHFGSLVTTHFHPEYHCIAFLRNVGDTFPKRRLPKTELMSPMLNKDVGQLCVQRFIINSSAVRLVTSLV